jgi:protein TIF31
LAETQDEAAKADRAKRVVESYSKFAFDGCFASLAEFAPENYGHSLSKCIEGISPSSFNPPPCDRRISGDLLYLNVKTLEGTSVEVTCSVKGFFINSSTEKFNPQAKEGSEVYLTLVQLLSSASPLFVEGFAAIEKELVSAHPFNLIAPSLPVYPWAVKKAEHTGDSGRSLDAYLTASDVIDTLTSRDFNEDIQSAAELPRETGNDRILRDQARFKAHSDFIEAATKGAVAVVNKSIMPLNPSGDEESQMFIHNNIFFSAGYENQEQFDSYGGAPASHVATSKDINGIRALSKLDMDKVFTIGTAVIDFKGTFYLTR